MGLLEPAFFGGLPVIPSRSSAAKKAHCPKRIYRRRHKIVNYFCRIKDWRRLATRYDKLARNFLAPPPLASAPSIGSNCESRP
jgi:transposase